MFVVWMILCEFISLHHRVAILTWLAIMDTGIQHENEPWQGPSAIFWHAKDFATAHEPEKLHRRSEPNLNISFIVCPSGVNFGQCDASITECHRLP